MSIKQLPKQYKMAQEAGKALLATVSLAPTDGDAQTVKVLEQMNWLDWPIPYAAKEVLLAAISVCEQAKTEKEILDIAYAVAMSMFWLILEDKLKAADQVIEGINQEQAFLDMLSNMDTEVLQ